jgi:trans-2,3-dihydro-3-hydroxyanthranilate isomerase
MPNTAQRRDYTISDVFTDEAFGGNPLAIVHDGSGLSTTQMQRMAREFNLSETVFVVPPHDPGNDHRLRIFTPAIELPFAGHPTVGTALFLADRADQPVERLRFEEPVGVVIVDIDGDHKEATLSAAVAPTFDGTTPAADAAAILGLPAAAVPRDAELASAGVAFLFVEVATLDDLAAAAFDRTVWATTDDDARFGHIFVLCGPTAPGSTFRGRMFAPAMGIAEDPATGAAATALAALLATRAGGDGTFRWTLEQGVEMGRPSTLHLAATVTAGHVTDARVGGQAAFVASGSMAVPRP